MKNEFFEQRTPQSEIKAEIVSNYFGAWARVISSNQEKWPDKWGCNLAYVDLMAGPGTYESGEGSTPILILDQAIQHDELRNRLVLLFNDQKALFSQRLHDNIDALTAVRPLAIPPKVFNKDVSDGYREILAEVEGLPKLVFADPWGYRGLSLDLFASVMKDRGSELIFLFNFNRILPALSNEGLIDHMTAMLGETRRVDLCRRLKEIGKSEREDAIVEEQKAALKDIGAVYTLWFRFKFGGKRRTSHYLVFVTKNDKGFGIMKDIMSKSRNYQLFGDPEFTYDPALAEGQLSLRFDPLIILEDILCQDFAGKTLSRAQIYNEHQRRTNFTDKEYRQALEGLEAKHKIETTPPAIERPRRQDKPTFGENVMVRFPSKES